MSPWLQVRSLGSTRPEPRVATIGSLTAPQRVRRGDLRPLMPAGPGLPRLTQPDWRMCPQNSSRCGSDLLPPGPSSSHPSPQQKFHRGPGAKAHLAFRGHPGTVQPPPRSRTAPPHRVPLPVVVLLFALEPQSLPLGPQSEDEPALGEVEGHEGGRGARVEDQPSGRGCPHVHGELRPACGGQAGREAGLKVEAGGGEEPTPIPPPLLKGVN